MRYDGAIVSAVGERLRRKMIRNKVRLIVFSNCLLGDFNGFRQNLHFKRSKKKKTHISLVFFSIFSVDKYKHRVRLSNIFAGPQQFYSQFSRA